MRDHDPLTIEEFNGYFNRGDKETVPPDHFAEINNIKFTESGFASRDGIGAYQQTIVSGIGLKDILRIHPYTMQSGQSLLVLIRGGLLYHIPAPNTISLILTLPLMTDFNAVSIAGRAFITPFFTNSNNQEVGLQNEYLYVYKGDSSAARRVGGDPPTGTALVATASGAGFSDLGFKIFAIVYETDTGYLTAPGPATFGTATSISETIGFDITNIPIPTDTFILKKWVVATKTILNYNGNQDQYQFFFVPGGEVANAATTKHVDFYDIDLLDDASHLIDNFPHVPAGVGLCTYHGRLVLTTTFTDISVAYVSHAGEPEAIDQVDGVLIVPLDGNPLTNCQEFRDVLYLFKKTRTVGYSDNQDVPSTWQPFMVDEAIGAPVHGVGTVLDSGGVNVDFLLIADYSGIMLFNGSYSRPEASWKIRDFWFGLDRTQFRKIELVNDSVAEILYCVLPTGAVLVGNYQNGLSHDKIRWSKWTFDVLINTLELINTSTLILGAPLAGVYSGIYQVIPDKKHDSLYTLTNTTVDFKIPDPLIQTAYTDLGEGESINHYAAIRVRVNGLGNLRPTLYSLDNIITQTLVPLVMQSITDRQPVRLCNFQTQRASLELKTTALDEWFRINRIILFSKELYIDFPSVQ